MTGTRAAVFAALPIVASLVLSGCGDASRGSAAAPTSVDTDRLPGMEPLETLRLGGPDASGPTVFSRPPPLAVAPDGSLLVLARSANEVRRFGPDGTFSGTIGGEGEGPGEFTTAWRLGLVGDTVWIGNLMPPRVSFFTLDGTLVRTLSDPAPVIGRGGIPEGPAAMLLGGSWFMVGVAPWGGPGGRVDVPLLIAHPGGARDTVGTTVDPVEMSVPGVGTFGGMRPWPRSPLYGALPGGGGVLVADFAGPGIAGGDVVLRRYRPDASLERVDTIRFPPVPLAATVADSMVEAVSDSVRARMERLRQAGIGAPDPPGDLARVVTAELGLGDTAPPIRRLLAGLDGTLWLQRVLGPSASESEWVVLDRDTRPLFRVDLPSGATLRAASRQAVWTTETDALDVPYVVRYELRAARVDGG